MRISIPCDILHFMEGTLTTAELAHRLGLTPSGISRMVKRGALEPAIKLPGVRGAFLFDVASVEALTEGVSNDHD